MPITSWKIMVRRAEQAGYHYSATHNRGRAPSVGEGIDLPIGERQMRFTVTEVFKQHLAKGGFEVFTVMVDETEVLLGDQPQVSRRKPRSASRSPSEMTQGQSHEGPHKQNVQLGGAAELKN